MKKTHGFTLVELLVVIGIIVVLIALLLPAIGMVRDRGRSTQCQNNLAEVGVALGRANSAMPQPLRAAVWTARLPAFLDGETDLFNCPSEFDGGRSYGMNDRLHRMLGGDGSKIAMLDYDTEQAAIVRSSVSEQNWEQFHDPRHQGRVNVLLYSGAVTAHDPETIDPAYCKPFYVYWRPMRDHNMAIEDCLIPENPPPSATDGSSTDGSTSGTTDGTTDGTADGTPDPDQCSVSCDVSASLVAHYPLDDPDPAEDISGNGNHGQVYGNPVYSTDRGGCMFFDGDDDFIDVPDDILKNDAGTVSLWMNATGFSGDPDVRLAFGNIANGGSANRFYIGQDDPSITGLPPGNCFVAFHGHKHQSEYQLQLNQWYHVVMVWCDGGGKAYIDGQLFFEDDVNYTNVAYKVSIASILQGHHGYWMGYVDDVRVYDCGLSPSQFPQ